MATEAKLRGYLSHKPDCPCHTCAARNRKKEALALAIGSGGDSSPLPSEKASSSGLAVIHADRDVTTYGRTARDRIAQWVAIRAQEPGIQNKEIAKRLGICEGHMNNLVTDATREGWLKFDDPLSKVEYEIIPKVMDNLNHFLDQKDKLVTLETAKNTVFKQFQESKGIRESNNNILALRIETVDPESIRVITGNILGTPRTLDAEIVKES